MQLLLCVQCGLTDQTVDVVRATIYCKNDAAGKISVILCADVFDCTCFFFKYD